MTKSKAFETQPEPAKTAYFFPNTGEAPSFGCEATSLEEADAANRDHLKQSKENQ